MKTENGCLFTEQDWVVWEEIDKRQAERDFREKITLSPCCKDKLRRLIAVYWEKGGHKHQKTDLYICSNCKKIFRMTVKIEVPNEPKN